MLAEIRIDCLHCLLGNWAFSSTSFVFDNLLISKVSDASLDIYECKKWFFVSGLKFPRMGFHGLRLNKPGYTLNFSWDVKGEYPNVCFHAWWKGALTFVETKRMRKTLKQTFWRPTYAQAVFQDMTSVVSAHRYANSQKVINQVQTYGKETFSTQKWFFVSYIFGSVEILTLFQTTAICTKRLRYSFVRIKALLKLMENSKMFTEIWL